MSFDYIWGETLGELDRLRPDARIANLETSVTVSEESWPSKGINYRMHPGNVPCLTAARIDCCVLANNHVLDWGRPGLAETLTVLHGAGIRTAGAGNDALEAATPAIIGLSDGKRVLVFAFGTESSGVGRDWKATRKRAGVNWIGELSTRAADAIGEQVAACKRVGDIVIASIHWGGNWGFEVSSRERVFAHRLIDGAGIDLVHGHSSHHVRGIEVYRGKAILYGCGDLLNDYEGISGHESYRGDLGLMYLPTIDSESGALLRFVMMPTRIHRLRVDRAPADGVAWPQEHDGPGVQEARSGGNGSARRNPRARMARRACGGFMSGAIALLAQDVSIAAETVTMPGLLRMPPAAKGLVLFAHGSGSSRFSPRNTLVANLLGRAKFATLLFDLLTPKEEQIDSVTRELRFDIALLTERLVDATRWVLKEPRLKELALGYFGASTGAAAALAAAARVPAVSAVVSRGGRPDLAGAALADVRAATLLIVGGADREVLELNRQALAQLRCEARLEVVPHATHLFEEPGTLEKVGSLAAEWFARYLA